MRRLPLLLPIVAVTASAILLLPESSMAAGPAEIRRGATPEAVWPLPPPHRVVRGFDPPASAWGSGHRGVDLLGRTGMPVRASKAGRISFAGRLAGRGVVVVDHGALRTTYEPVAAGVRVGQPVSAGQVVGRLQHTRSHCLPRACLHWGLLRGRTYLDPLTLVGAGPVRLLPLDAGTRLPRRSKAAALGPPNPFAAGVEPMAQSPAFSSRSTQ